VCPICRQPVGSQHLETCSEGRCQEISRLRPADYASRSSKEQYLIDRRLGILDWCGF
jgi:hypothetical protein